MEALSFKLNCTTRKAYPENRSDVKLMVVDRATGKFESKKFVEIMDYIEGDDCWVNAVECDHAVDGRIEKETVYADKGSSLKTSVIPSAGVMFEDWMIERLRPKKLYLATPQWARLGSDVMRETMTTPPEEYMIPLAYIDTDESKKYTMLGSTACKAMESYALYKKARWISSLFIAPGFEFKMTGKLLTNFHYVDDPHMYLTCAFAGTELMHEAYKFAGSDYFYSDRGDRMLII